MRSFISSFTFVACLTTGAIASAQDTAPAPGSQTTSTTQATTAAPGTAGPTTATTAVTTTTPAPAVAPITPAPTTTTTSALLPSQTPSSDVPPETKTDSPINRPLMVTGVVLLGGTYAASAIDSQTSGFQADKNYLYYPIVGPWMDLAHRDCDVNPCNNETGNKALLILDGVGQGLGAISIVASLFLPEKTTRGWYLIGDSNLHAAPGRVGTGYGFGAGGVF